MDSKNTTEGNENIVISADSNVFWKCNRDLQKQLFNSGNVLDRVKGAFEIIADTLKCNEITFTRLKSSRKSCRKKSVFRYIRPEQFEYFKKENWVKIDSLFISELTGIICYSREYVPEMLKSWFFDNDIENGILLPINFSDGRLFGVINIVSPVKYMYNDDFLQSIRITFSIAFENYKILDINEKQIHELEKAKKVAEEASEVKSRFLANMSHEIRTPMNAVIGMAEIAMREDLPKRAEESILQIRASGEHLLSIINDILDFSKLESGKLQIIDVNYRILTLLNDVENIIQPRMRTKNIDFFIELDPKIPEVLLGDENRIRQVLLNFVNNSIKFTESGKITLRVVIVERMKDDITLRFEVEDTGSGIREYDLKRLFTAFEQVDKVKHYNVEGTGLGLAISKLLITLMNGKIGVTSEYGKGSTFYIELRQKIVNALPCGLYRYLAPVDREEEQICFVAPEAKILLADDIGMNVIVAKGLLAPYKMKIDVAYDGLQVIEMLERGNRYDLIFMDHMMPKMDGIETTLKIRQMADEYFKNVPIIAFTANAVKSAQELFEKSGMNDFVSKPIAFKELTRVLLNWLPKNLIQPSDENALETDFDWNDEIQKLSEILDITVVKKYFLGKMDVYLTALRKFINDADARNDKITKAYADGNWEDYTTYVHSLKSSCATIGAVDLSAMARELEIAGKAEAVDYITTHTEATLQYVRNLTSALREMLDEETRKEKRNSSGVKEVPVISEELDESMNKLRNAIYNAKISDAEDILEKMNSNVYNGRPLKTFADKIRAMLDDFMLDEAVALIDDFLVEQTGKVNMD